MLAHLPTLAPTHVTRLTSIHPNRLLLKFGKKETETDSHETPNSTLPPDIFTRVSYEKLETNSDYLATYATGFDGERKVAAYDQDNLCFFGGLMGVVWRNAQNCQFELRF